MPGCSFAVKVRWHGAQGFNVQRSHGSSGRTAHRERRTDQSGSGVSSMRPAKPTAASSRSVNSPATSGSRRSARSARAAAQVASRARSRLQEPSRWVSGSTICREVGTRHQLVADALLQRHEEITPPGRTRPPARRVRSRAYDEVSTTASARSWPMCALMPASANCSGRTPGWRRNWNRGPPASGRPVSVLQRVEGGQVTLREPHVQRGRGPGVREATGVDVPVDRLRDGQVDAVEDGHPRPARAASCRGRASGGGPCPPSDGRRDLFAVRHGGGFAASG